MDKMDWDCSCEANPGRSGFWAPSWEWRLVPPALPFWGCICRCLKGHRTLLVFFLVISSSVTQEKSHSGVIKTVVALLYVQYCSAAVIAVFASMIFPVQMTLTNAAADATAPQELWSSEQSSSERGCQPHLFSGKRKLCLGILTWAILLGLAFVQQMTPPKVLADIADGTSLVVSWIINLAPFGIFGLVFNTVSTNGLDIFTTYGKLLALLVGCMLFIYFVTIPFWFTGASVRIHIR